jgi:hypothetical protein
LTRDGVEVELMANIDPPEELSQYERGGRAESASTAAVPLRNGSHLPTEEDHHPSTGA